MTDRTLLVLCTGNICRSPMAQVVLSRALPDWRVESAGLAALVGKSAAPEALQALGERSRDLSGFQARQVDEPMLRGAELVLVMTRDQKARVEEQYPWVCGRVFRLGQWDGLEIDDPFQRGLEAFQRSLALIENCVPAWAVRLRFPVNSSEMRHV